MSRVFVLIGIAIANAARGIRRASTTSLLAVVTIAVVLVLLGSAWLLVGNMAARLREFGADLQVAAYLESDLSDERQNELALIVSRAPGVEKVAVVTQAEALVRFEQIAGSAELLEGLEENPLPPSLEITLAPESRSPSGIALLEAALAEVEGIDGLAHGEDWIEGYARAIALVRSLALGIGGVLALAALLIVANTIRLAVHARRDELDILALVGASRTFVRVPFLLEGTIQGLLGGLLALGLVYAGYTLLLPQLEDTLALLLGNAGIEFFTAPQSVALVAAGGGLGLLGSLAALVGGRATS